MRKASEVFSPEELERIRYICKIFKGRVVNLIRRSNTVDVKDEV